MPRSGKESKHGEPGSTKPSLAVVTAATPVPMALGMRASANGAIAVIPRILIGTVVRRRA